MTSARPAGSDLSLLRRLNQREALAALRRARASPLAATWTAWGSEPRPGDRLQSAISRLSSRKARSRPTDAPMTRLHENPPQVSIDGIERRQMYFPFDRLTRQL